MLTIRTSSLRGGTDQTRLPVDGAAVLLAYSNGTYLTGVTNASGECDFELYRLDDDMTLLAAAEGHMDYRNHGVSAHHLLGKHGEVKMEPGRERLNSISFTKSTGCIPGISGGLNPINDVRCYVYADNVAINGMLAHPANFEMGEWLDLVDVRGMKTAARFLEITGQFSLMEFTTPEPY